MTRLLILAAGCFLYLAAAAQIPVEAIEGWTMLQQKGQYHFTPNNSAGKKISYKIMPLFKSENANISDWLQNTATKELLAAGYRFSASNKSSSKIREPFYLFITIVTDGMGNEWAANFMAHPYADGMIRYSSIILPPGDAQSIFFNNAVGHFTNFCTKENASQSSTQGNKPVAIKKDEQAKIKPKENSASTKNGLKPAAIKGIVINMEYGYSGYEYRPYLLLNDGSFYQYPKVSPYELDIATSRRNESAKWGTWKLEGKTLVVQFTKKDGTKKTERWERNWSWTKSAAANEKIEKSFSSISSVGFSGGTTTVATGNITFNKNGQFTLLKAVGVTSNDYKVHPSAYADKNAAGTYILDGYSLELRFNNGETTKKLFYFYSDSRRAINIGGTVYTVNDK